MLEQAGLICCAKVARGHHAASWAVFTCQSIATPRSASTSGKGIPASIQEGSDTRGCGWFVGDRCMGAGCRDGGCRAG